MCMLEHANAGMRVSVLVILARKKKKERKEKKAFSYERIFSHREDDHPHLDERCLCVNKSVKVKTSTSLQPQLEPVLNSWVS